MNTERTVSCVRYPVHGGEHEFTATLVSAPDGSVIYLQFTQPVSFGNGDTLHIPGLWVPA